MPKIRSQINPQDELFKANQQAMQSQVETLSQKLSRICLGGPESAQQRHLEHGKLLVRDRINN